MLQSTSSRRNPSRCVQTRQQLLGASVFLHNCGSAPGYIFGDNWLACANLIRRYSLIEIACWLSSLEVNGEDIQAT